LCRVGSGCLSINPYAHIPSRKATFFLFRSSGSMKGRNTRIYPDCWDAKNVDWRGTDKRLVLQTARARAFAGPQIDAGPF